MSNKHDANVRKSTLVNFQVGLIASLLFTYVIFEMYTTVSVIDPVEVAALPIENAKYPIDIFKEEPRPKKEVAVKTKKIAKPDWTKPKEADLEKVVETLKEQFGGDTNQKKESSAIPVDSIMSIPVEEKIIYDISKVTVAPIYPGCEKYNDNEERIACFSSKIRTIISRKFNTDLGSEYGLSGVQRIDVQFQVDTKGMVNDVRVRAPHPALEKEARRVVGKFLTMIPGKVENKPVEVEYMLPIQFKIQN